MVDQIFNFVFRMIGWLIGRTIRFTFDVLVYAVTSMFYAWKQRPKEMVLPLAARFEHTHIVAGSGHGKTQLMQRLLLEDLHELTEGKGSVVVMDSQGDLINNVLHLKMMEQLNDKIVIIDPHDVENPPALNLFDFGLSETATLSPIDREMVYNSAVSLYVYIFGALLGAELTSRQGMIFRFLARLMMEIPGATIYTLMDLVEHPEMTKPYLASLDPLSRRFFEHEFTSRVYDETRAQIKTRLYTVLANNILARMFAHEHNMVDIGKAMNSGSLILINTAKDLLKQEGCEILGRFFIALILQSTVERAIIPVDRRRATFVYIDEAHEYFDESLEDLLVQARKFKVGMILAHQNLDQLAPSLKATNMSNTSIKIAGGLSGKDAKDFVGEWQCDPRIFAETGKNARETRFACAIRNHKEPIVLHVPLGLMESQPKLEPAGYQKILEGNRKRISAPAASAKIPEYQTAGASSLGQPEVL